MLGPEVQRKKINIVKGDDVRVYKYWSWSIQAGKSQLLQVSMFVLAHPWGAPDLHTIHQLEN